jgi:phosphoribosylanthranilate isomerase
MTAGKNPYRIKVCGMRNAENIRLLANLMPDYIGFILYPESKRYLGSDYKLEVEIPSQIKRVGVFVNEVIEEVFRWINLLDLDLVQLHGDEPEEYCKELNKMNVPVIKAFGMDEHFDFSLLKPYEPYCEYFLFDTKTDLKGGSGKKFNRNILKKYNSEKPFFLSGGIGPEDTAIVNDLPDLPLHAIDINSRFEEAPGIKNIELIARFITELRKQTSITINK